jgi:acyl carrier protein
MSGSVSRKKIEKTVRDIIAQVAGVKVADVGTDLLLREDLMLDSLKEMEIVARTEVLFGISLDEGSLPDIHTLEDFCNLVEQALKPV